MRRADPSEVPQLARVWYDGWLDAHADILPAELARMRTLASFHDRLEAMLDAVRVAGPIGEPLGFSIVNDDELYQLFVAATARGTGVAAALLADAESRIAAHGASIAWLACAIGNHRAARFYEKHGWHNAGVVVSHLDTPEGVFDLDVWRYEKRVG